jgi:ketosteroid isomerase-like protein
MSRENIEAVEAMLEAFGDRDLDAMMECADADVELRPAVVGGIEGTVYRGVELDTASGFVFRLRGGKVSSFRSFVSKEEALEAAELTE